MLPNKVYRFFGYQKNALIKLLVLFIGQTILLPGFSQINSDGIPFITNYSPRTYNADELNWSVTQDHRGVMYFGNNEYILEFDGRNWERIEMPGQSFVLSLAAGNDGIIYAGGVDDFGHLVVDSIGQLKYKSLAGKIDENIQITRVWKTYAHNDLIYFCTNQNIFIYNKIDKTIETVKLPKDNFFSFLVNDKLYTGNLDIGLLVLQDNKLTEVAGGDHFIDKDIFSILPWSQDTLLIYTSQEGLCLYNTMTGGASDFSFSDTAKKTNIALMENFLYAGVKLNDSLFAFGTYVDGLYVIDKTGSIITHLDEQSGLQDETISNLFFPGDDSGVLWLTLANGISSVNISSPVRRFGSESGIHGAIYGVTKHKETYYIATMQGVYRKETHPSERTVFKDIKGISGEQVYGITNINTPGNKEILIAASTRNIYIIKDDEAIEKFSGIETLRLLHSKAFPSRIYVGTNRGLSLILIEDNDLLFQDEKFGISEGSIIDITEDTLGNLWIETLSDLHLLDTDGSHLNLPGKLDNKSGKFFNFKNDLFFISGNEVYKYDYTEHDFHIYNPLNKLFFFRNKNLEDVYPLNDTSALAHYKINNTSYSDLLIRKQNTWYADTLALRIIPPVSINTAFADNQYILAGSHDGLFIYNKQREKDYDLFFKSLIITITIGADSVVYKGGDGFLEQIEDKSAEIKIFPSNIKYPYNNIIFNFSAPYFEKEDDIIYSSYLEGFETNWSPWISEGTRTFTNLREGNYRFHVKARNMYGVESQVAIIEFTISPPWYRTWWAYLSYIILGIIIIIISISLYTRKLQQDKKRLERIVKERTAEILEKNKVIEQKNKSITDSIRYAKRIQTAVLPDKQTLDIFEYFIYFKPRDIVSGDFYWLNSFEDKQKLVVAAADCTGHGVPGAFMSMLGAAFLNEIVAMPEIQHSDQILNILREYVINALSQGTLDEEQFKQKDGMDVGLAVIDINTKILEFSGANNSMLLIRNGELTEYKPDRMPIGTYRKQDIPFSRTDIQLENNDIFYLFSDGYVDQFGGKEGKKYMKKRFRELILSIHTKPLNEQNRILENEMDKWSKGYEQLDDQIVIGMKVSL